MVDALKLFIYSVAQDSNAERRCRAEEDEAGAP